MSTEDDRGQCDAAANQGTAGVGGTNRHAVRKTKKSKGRKSPESAVATSASGPGSWLTSGVLGVPTEDNSEGEDDGDGDDGDELPGVTIGTQWEEGGGEAVAKAPERTLPPWAKKWTPPVPEAPPPVDETPSTLAKSTQAASGLDWITSALSGAPAAPTKAADDPDAHDGASDGGGGGGGLDWLVQVANIKSETAVAVALADDPLVAAISSRAVSAGAPITPSMYGTESSEAAGAGGLDWLSAATVGGQITRAPSASGAAVRRRSLARKAPAPATGSWLATFKLGVSTEDDSGDDGDATTAAGTKSTTELSPMKERKFKNEASTATSAGAPGGWLTSGSLGVAQDERDEDGSQGGVDGSTGPKMADIGTQWEEGGGETVAKYPGRTLPPWAKKWAAPAPDPSKPDKQESSTPGSEAKKRGSGINWIDDSIPNAPAVTTGACEAVLGIQFDDLGVVDALCLV